MRFHYAGKFDGDPESLPHGEHMPGAVKFKEPEDSKKLAVIASFIGFSVFVVAMLLYLWRMFTYDFPAEHPMGAMGRGMFVGLFLFVITMVPHEFLHAICFKEDVYLYENLKQGMLFVVGPETMSKGRFIFMNLLPNLAFGVLPLALAIIFWPLATWLAWWGLFALTGSGGDLLNVFNAITQMPRGARTYLHGFNSWWYLPWWEGISPSGKRS